MYYVVQARCDLYHVAGLRSGRMLAVLIPIVFTLLTSVPAFLLLPSDFKVFPRIRAENGLYLLKPITPFCGF